MQARSSSTKIGTGFSLLEWPHSSLCTAQHSKQPCSTLPLLLLLPGLSFCCPAPSCLPGAPAGIVGITAACLGAHVMLTDMRDVLPQIYENVQANAELIEAAGGSATVAELDWLEPDDEVRQRQF